MSKVCEQKGLEKLRISWTTINELSADIYRLKQLKYLSLENTSIRSLSPGIESLTSLEELRMKDINHVTIPSGIEAMKWLRTLAIPLHMNRKLPKELLGMDRPENLELSATGYIQWSSCRTGKAEEFEVPKARRIQYHS